MDWTDDGDGRASGEGVKAETIANVSNRADGGTDGVESAGPLPSADQLPSIGELSKSLAGAAAPVPPVPMLSRETLMSVGAVRLKEMMREQGLDVEDMGCTETIDYVDALVANQAQKERPVSYTHLRAHETG